MLPQILSPELFYFYFKNIRKQNIGMGKKLKKIFFGTGVTVLIVFVILYLPFTQYKLTQVLNVEENVHPAKAIVVLGGGLKSDGSLGISTRERVRYGVFLFKLGFGDYLILSGGDEVNGKLEADQMYKMALNEGIPPEAVIKEDNSLNTHENAIYTKKILSRYGIEEKVILVTSPYHIKRALFCFRRQGIKVLPAPVKNSEIYTYGLYQSLRNISLLVHEFLALAWYRYTGRI